MPEPIKPITPDISPDGVPLQPEATAKVDAPALTITPPVDKPTEAAPVIPEVKVEDKPEVTLDDFLDAGATHKEPAKKEDSAPVIPDVKPPVKLVVEPTAPVKPLARDFSDIDVEHKEAFERMSNEAFNKLKPLYLDRKQKIAELNAAQQKVTELEKGIVKIPESYYEHPNAVVLTPEFEAASNDAQLANGIQQHWENQLTAIREGAVEFENLGFDNKNNVIKTKVPADAKAEAYVLRALGEANNYAIGRKANLQAIVNTHKSKVGEAIGQLSAFEKQSFSAFDKPENENLRTLVEATKKTFHPSFANNPLLSGYSKSLVAIQQLVGIIQQLQAKVGAPTAPSTNGAPPAPIVPSDQRKAGPTAGSAGGGGGGAVIPEVTMDDFNAVKNN